MTNYKRPKYRINITALMSVIHDIKMIFLVIMFFVVLVSFIAIFIDSCRFPESYISTWRYQLEREISNGDEEAIEYYYNTYIKNGRNLFE